MKVRIIKCSHIRFWYARRIGEEFEVDQYTNRFYLYGKNRVIDKNDCVLV